MLAKLTGNKMILGAVVGILGGVLVAVLLVGVLGVGGAPAAPAEAGKEPVKAAAGAPKKAIAGKEQHAEAQFGPVYYVRDRIVNLADPGGRRYLRFTVAIEFEEKTKEHAGAPPSSSQLALYEPEVDRHDYQPTTGGGGKADPEKEFLARIKKYVPAIEDVVTTVLSSKTSADVMSVEGKEQAKREIRDRVQRLLGEEEHVTNVYFTEFVIQ